ncbi:MAG: Gldg family protein [Pseudomonadales bacterium]|nr:Gldg family protein [Pseudomonadales bacterium]
MKLNATLSLILVLVTFLLFTVVNNYMASGVRVDLTENNLYTVSDGTREIIGELEEPINLYFFFSGKVSQDLTSLRAYARRVQEMLEEYELIAGGNIRLTVIDPEPFSEEEDQAASFGLQSVPVNQAGDELYFGLAGTNALDGEEVIAFFQPDREEFLEYDVTKLIHSLGAEDRPTLGIYSGIPVESSVDPRTFQQVPGWVFRDQLEELFQIDTLEELDSESLSGINLLLLVHPKGLSETDIYAVDQFVMVGGKLIAFIDPLAEMDQPESPGMQMPGGSSSNLNRLTEAWGVSMREGQVLGDPAVALLVGGADGRPVRHLGIVGFTPEYLGREDVVTADLEIINMSTVGILDIDSVEGVRAEPLIVSSDQGGALDTIQFQFLQNPEELIPGFSSAGEPLVAAVRLSGKAASAFPEGPPGESEVGQHLSATEELQVVVVADSDVLSDRLWVQVQNFFGQQIASAFADNGSFVTNLVDNLSGSSALIDVRSRGQYTRPFEVVENLRREAEAQYLQSAEDLQAQLSETERQLAELESTRIEDGLLTLTPEQEAALLQFQDEKLRIRKELRDVRHQLDKDIEQLGSMLKIVNILVMPLLLTGLLLAFRILGLGRRSSLS